jgi:hypothetical protein
MKLSNLCQLLPEHDPENVSPTHSVFSGQGKKTMWLLGVFCGKGENWGGGALFSWTSTAPSGGRLFFISKVY